MKIYVPDYYKDFNCIADKCKHTCCKGWEIEIDDDSMSRYSQYPYIMEKIEYDDDNHFKLMDGEVCPFLLEKGLCDLIIKYGEEILCQTCRDHPRFRNFWSTRIEMGLGLVCEEAARLILDRKDPMKLELLEINDENDTEASDDEIWLRDFRDSMLEKITGEGPLFRLREYLIYRHIADALYDDRLEQRIKFIDTIMEIIESKWKETDMSMESLVEIVTKVSYDLEYDEEEKEKYLTE